MNNKYKILVISSRSPHHFAGLGEDLVKALTMGGHLVDYLTLFQTDDPYVIGVYPKQKKNLKDRISKVFPFLSYFAPILHNFTKTASQSKYMSRDGITLVNPDENRPPVDIDLILRRIKKQYDFVYIHCWQDMLTSKTIKAIFGKLKVPILLGMYDMSPITGGCYYFRSCRNFTHECGCCPVLGSEDPNDITHVNFLAKKACYGSISCSMASNDYIKSFVLESGLFDEGRIDISRYSLDENIFAPRDVNKCRGKMSIPARKTFVLFCRYAGLQHKGKGYDYLIESVNMFADMLTAEEKGKVILLIAGEKDAAFAKRFNISVKNVGFLNKEQLINAYSAATVFLSPSVDDAGPSMVNQSITCGTPVVAFNIGSACYMVDNGETGYRVELKNTKEYALGIKKIFDLSDTEYSKMKETCRIRGVEKCSLASNEKRIINRYLRIIERNKDLE